MFCPPHLSETHCVKFVVAFMFYFWNFSICWVVCDRISLYSIDWPWTSVILCQLPEYWDYRCEPTNVILSNCIILLIGRLSQVFCCLDRLPTSILNSLGYQSTRILWAKKIEKANSSLESTLLLYCRERLRVPLRKILTLAKDPCFSLGFGRIYASVCS